MQTRECGFTLLEIMIVVVIIGILGALIVPNIVGRADEARVTATRTDMRSIGAALDLYRLDHGQYPTTTEGLAALTQPRTSGSANSSYLRQIPKDAWGRPYLYISPGASEDYDLLSLGADGAQGGDGSAQDLSIWDE